MLIGRYNSLLGQHLSCCTKHRGHHTATFAPGAVGTRRHEALYDQDTATFAPGTVGAFEQSTISATMPPLDQASQPLFRRLRPSSRVCTRQEAGTLAPCSILAISVFGFSFSTLALWPYMNQIKVLSYLFQIQPN